MSSEADLPRSIRRGPPITIKCECGEGRDLHYGELWTCERCGRRWSTLHIPAAEYEQLRRTELRYRWIPVAVAAVVIAFLIVLIAAGRAFGAFMLAALAAMAWTVYGRPQWNRRYLQTSQNPSSWTIGPE
ncbi:MAG TPA: hypothetical protein VMA77_04590 [Solirubrobacteraceae bacterium]|nr:hypothetical protein [Solirubrobacteraceae bacterium]